MREKGKGGVQREVCPECLFEYWSEDTEDYDDHDGHKKYYLVKEVGIVKKLVMMFLPKYTETRNHSNQ